MTRRNIELALLCIAAPLAILLFAMIALNQGEELGWASIGVPVGIFASFIVSHLALRKFAPAADPAILPICFALSSIGIAFVTRLAPDLAVRQVAWLVLGIIFMIAVIIFMKNMDKTANYKYTLMVIGLILLLSPLLPGIGNEIYGSRIWLSIGSFSFQPGEIAKIFIVLFLAGYLAQNREMLSVFTHKVGPFKFPDLSTLLPLLIMWLLSMAIVVFEKDLWFSAHRLLRVPHYALRGKRQEVLPDRRLAHDRHRCGHPLFLLFTCTGARRYLARPLR